MVPPATLDIAQACLQLQNDIGMYQKIQNTHYLNSWTSIPKAGSLHMAWEYASDLAHHYLFVQMPHVSSYVFAVTSNKLPLIILSHHAKHPLLLSS